eukprot:6204297-Pleurochrysis_carterae.AAC.7
MPQCFVRHFDSMKSACSYRRHANNLRLQTVMVANDGFLLAFSLACRLCGLVRNSCVQMVRSQLVALICLLVLKRLRGA